MSEKETGRDADHIGPAELTSSTAALLALPDTEIKTAAAAVDIAAAGGNRLPILAAGIRAEHRATVDALKSVVTHAMAAGDLLAEAKKLVPHGGWRGWVAENCELSERSVQLYMKLAKHRAVIEKEQAKTAMGVADLTLNEAAALCVLAGRLERLLDFAKRAEGSTTEQIVDLCVAEGFTVIKDASYDPFFGRSEAEVREWVLFGLFIGGGSPGAFDHVEWILQRPFQNVDEWLGPEGSKFRKPYGWRDSPPKFHKGWARFKIEYADKTRKDIEAEIFQLWEDHRGPVSIPFLLGASLLPISKAAVSP